MKPWIAADEAVAASRLVAARRAGRLGEVRKQRCNLEVARESRRLVVQQIQRTVKAAGQFL